MVEHDLDCLKASDAIIELGPESGAKGGEVIFNGPIDDWRGIKIEPKLESHFESSLPANWPVLSIKNATARNLKGFDLSIPLNSLVAISGPSGSGKSSLIHEVLESAFQRYRLKLNDPKENLVTGFEQINQFLLVDQSPIARSPRGNIATYSGIWDTVRDLLASTEKAQELALSRSAFSFNVDRGRCVACSGAGFVREDMQFLSDVYLPCDSCLGKRFQASVLSVEYKGKSVDQLLEISVEEAAELFATHSKISLLCEVLISLGLGYLRLGHPLSELSGGEAQRLKLVPYIAKDNSQKNLFIFDEPTTGLHAKDVERLVALFKLLRTKGHSIICIEHNLALLTASDWLIDLGPDGGDGGGYLLMQGTPKNFAEYSDSELGSTARFISEFVAQTKPKLKMLRPTKSSAAKQIEIRGAREHNLKNIDIDLPLNTLTAITGVSGSGKSSLAKDIIYAEGQRRYLDCLSPYARQFIKELTKPDIDSIRNILPTICVHQHTFQPGQLSTIATVSEVSNFLRLLLSKCGVQYCPEHPQLAISAFSAEQMAEQILAQSKAQTVRILAPIIKLKKGTHKAIFERAIKAEIAEVRVDGMWGRPSLFLEELEKSKPHSIDFVVARFAPKRVAKELLAEAISQALTLGSGTIISVSDQQEKILSTERACAICERGFFKPDPEDLSFHSRRGSCESCSGQGQIKEKPCPECNASRLKPIGRNVRLAGLNIHELSSFRPSELRKFLAKIEFSARDQAVSRPILLELNAKLDLLVKIGLDYLPLFRSAETLSSGELQRLRLSAAMGSPLSGVMFIFDEPSAGLHPLDNQRVISQLISLKERGNSVLVIEHDPSTILAAEHIIEIGPGGGAEGGQVVANQSLKEFLKRADSPTAKALTTELELSNGSIEGPTKWLRIKDASINNIKKLSLNLPLGRLVVVAGVSGAGKSSLLHGLIADQIGAAGGNSWNSARAKISSDIEIARLCLVDQKPIGKNSRSTPASYLGIWDEIRKLFANTLESRARGWSSSFFSYNAGKGRCSECGGMGMVRLEMSFLADAYSSCESCLGKRFSDQALSVKFLDLNPADMLALTFDQAKSIFVNHRRIFSVLSQGCELGLGYLRLGQSSSTLSGGESQRIKLVDELNTKRREHTLYILDEPTTGLHKQDVAKLVAVLRNLRSLGHSVMVIEHDEHVIASADYVIEFGPGPAEQGGQVVFEGSPIELRKAKTAWGEILDKAQLCR
jgi:excinuclease ABC subunit A